MKMMEKQSSNNNIMTTLSRNGADEKRQMMIRAPQKILEYTRTENGDFMITERMPLSHQQPSTSQTLTVSHQEEVMDEIAGTSGGDYSIKFVDIDNQLTYNITDEDDDGKFHDEQQFMMESEENQDMEEEQDEVEIVENKEDAGSSKNRHGVKVLSNVKLTSSEMFSPSIKDIIQQYNKQTEHAKVEEPERTASPTKEVDEKELSLIQCTETLNLSKEKEESTRACTSVIRKTTIEADSSVATFKTSQKAEPQPSTSGSVRKPNVVFNLNPTNSQIFKEHDYCLKDGHYLATKKFKQFLCDICGHGFNQMSHLGRHIEAVHLKIKRFSCDLCSKIFSHKHHMADHIKTHQNINESITVLKTLFQSREIPEPVLHKLPRLEVGRVSKLLRKGTQKGNCQLLPSSYSIKRGNSLARKVMLVSWGGFVGNGGKVRDDEDCSHLCNDVHCINPHHLTHEHNAQRRACHLNQRLSRQTVAPCRSCHAGPNCVWQHFVVPGVGASNSPNKTTRC